MRRVAGWMVWAIGATIGAVGLFVSGLILWFCYHIVLAPPSGGVSRFDTIAITYALAFVALVVGAACVRLILPQLRAPGGRILDPWSFRVLAVIYGLTLLGGAILNPDEAVIPITGVVLMVLLRAALRATFGASPPSGQMDDR